MARAFAGDLVVGEEMGGQDAVGSAGNFWLVDPIDGTANYATDVPRWCISIGYLEAGKPVLGVLFDPLMDRLYSAGYAGPRTNGGTDGVVDPNRCRRPSSGTGHRLVGRVGRRPTQPFGGARIAR